MFREIDEDGSGIVSLAEFKEAFVHTFGDGPVTTEVSDGCCKAFKDPAICDKFLMLGYAQILRRGIFCREAVAG